MFNYNNLFVIQYPPFRSIRLQVGHISQMSKSIKAGAKSRQVGRDKIYNRLRKEATND